MFRNLTVVAAVAFAVHAPPARSAEQKPKGSKNEQHIEARVRGTLDFEKGRGYFIAVMSGAKGERSSRVWLWISEDKVLVRMLDGLRGKEVVAWGNLEQMPADSHASVPPLGMYLGRLGFEIKGAKAAP